MNKFLNLPINLLYTMYFLLILLILMSLKTHPIMIMIILLIYSLLICLNLSMWKSNFIFSIILFLMMISGLLIIFLYFSSLISNEQFNMKMNFLTYMVIINILFFLYFNCSFMIMHKYNFQETNSIMKTNLSPFSNILNLFEYPMSNLTILSMFYLLISLFSIIKICSMKYFSMRKIN